MKRLTLKQKLYHLRRAKKQARPLARNKNKQYNYKKRGSIFRISLPSEFSLSTSHDEVLNFIETIRDKRVRSRDFSIHADFRTLKKIGPSAALFLAAEFDRWRKLGAFHHHVKDAHQWDRDILRLLNEMGFFEILKVLNPPELLESEGQNLKFIRFRSKNQTLGDQAKDLTEEIETLTGPLPERQKLFRSLTEAMTNVSNHAYPVDADYNIPYIKGQ